MYYSKTFYSLRGNVFVVVFVYVVLSWKFHCYML